MRLPYPPSLQNSEPSGVLHFGCPACQHLLTVPSAAAGVEGPCPLCYQKIIAPYPTLGHPARLATVLPAAVPAPFPTPSAPRQPVQVHAPPVLQPLSHGEQQQSAPPADQLQLQSQQGQVPADRSVRRVQCFACQSTLDVYSNTKVSGGPCPVCQAWIDLGGQSIPPAASQRPAPQREAVPQTKTLLSERRRRSPGGRAGTELPLHNEPNAVAAASTRAVSVVEEEKPALEKRRVLPDECYIGAAQRDPRDGPTNDSESSRVRRKKCRKKSIKLEERSDPAVSRWLLIFFGVLLPIINGAFVVLKMGWVTPQDLWFSVVDDSSMPGPPNHGLVEELQATRFEMNQRESQAYEAVEAAIHGFLNADFWEDAEQYLIAEAVPQNSEALSFLKVFPRETFRGCDIRVIRWSRIPDTDRFVFTTQLAVPDADEGGEKLSFMIAEQRESRIAGIHALQLYQSWKQTLTEFLETPGANEGRFYALVQLNDGRGGPAPIALPANSDYVRLRLQDNFVSHYWTTDAYARKDDWPGVRFSMKLTTANWAYAILDLEWKQGPTGDRFVNVKGIHSSNWGDFHS